jgi:hypothetical protein
MCIVIDMNIYIEPEVEKRLREEPSMSGLINNLLRKHYGIAHKDAPPKAGAKSLEPIEEPVYVSEEETPMIEKHDLRPKLNPTPGVVIDVGTQCEHGFGPKLCLIKGCKHYQFRKKR